MPYNNYNKLQKAFISFRIFFLRKNIYNKYIKNNYDKEIAFLEGPVTTLLSVKNKNTKKIAWIHNDISLVFGNNLKAKIKKRFNKKIYNKYKKLIFLSNHNLNIFNKFYELDILVG